MGLRAIFVTEFLVHRLAEGANRLLTVDSVRTAAEAPFPSLPVAALTITLVVAGYALFARGRTWTSGPRKALRSKQPLLPTVRTPPRQRAALS